MSNQTLSNRPIGKVRLFGCGGGGINIAKEYIADGHTADIAQVDVALIDTSDSNLADNLVEHAWLFNDLDGSGKIRNSNDKAIAKAIPDILRQFPPGDINIVVFTTSGGSGSVVAPLLIKSLLEDDQVVIGIAMGSHESIRSTENTIGTIKTLDAISRMTDKPVVIHFGMNDHSQPRSNIDRESHLMITSLAVLCSRRNHGLDTADIRSLIQFNKSTDLTAQLARIHVHSDMETFEEELDNAISVAYLKRDHDDPDPKIFAPYACEGFMPTQAQSRTCLFFGIENHSFIGVQKQLESLKKEMENQRRTRQQTVTFSDDDDEISATGLIF